MTTAATRRRSRDERILLTRITWEEYEAVRRALWEHPGIRVEYLEGDLEIMSPSREHDGRKSTIGRLVETWSLERRVRLYAFGSTTFRRKAKERGIEPDECYCLVPDREFPDLAIEVGVTPGGIDRLAIYQGLEVPEVWFFENGKFRVYGLGPEGYRTPSRSEVLPDLDLERLAHHVLQPDQHDAVVAWQEELRRGTK